MRIKKDFSLLKVCGETMLIADGEENIDFNNVICLNESAGFLLEQVMEQDFSSTDLTNLLVDNYDIDFETATKDTAALVLKLQETGLIAE